MVKLELVLAEPTTTRVPVVKRRNPVRRKRENPIAPGRTNVLRICVGDEDWKAWSGSDVDLIMSNGPSDSFYVQESFYIGQADNDPGLDIIERHPSQELGFHEH
jgi:hypothetical protein